MEPTTTASAGVIHAASSVGFMALLIGLLGEVGADVVMVMLASSVGCIIALSGTNTTSFLSAVKYMVISVIASSVLAWALTGLLTSYIPSLSSQYTPSLIAMFIGFTSDRLPKIFNKIVSYFEAKIDKE